MLLRRQGIYAQSKGLAAEYKCPAKQSSPILPCPVITDTKSAPFPSSSRLALTFYVQQTWKKPFQFVTMSEFNSSVSRCYIQCHYYQYHHLHHLHHATISDGVGTTNITITMAYIIMIIITIISWTQILWNTLCCIFSQKISSDMILIAFILLKQINKNPKAQKRKWFSWEYTLSQSLGKNSNPSSLSIATRFPHC